MHYIPSFFILIIILITSSIASPNMDSQKHLTKAEAELIVKKINDEKSSKGIEGIKQAAIDFKKESYFKAAQTYELAFKHFPNDTLTPSYLYTAALLYDSSATPDEAVRCNKLIASNYPKSNYAIDAAFSIGINYENRKKWKEAAEAYKDYSNQFDEDKAKLIASSFYAARSYLKISDTANATIFYRKTLVGFEKWGLQLRNADANAPAEAAFFLGKLEQKKLIDFKVSQNNKNTNKKMTTHYNSAINKFSKSARYMSKDWTFPANNEVANTYIIMASKYREILNMSPNSLSDKEKLKLLDIQNYMYKTAIDILQKNIELARKNGFYNDDIIEAEERLLMSYFKYCENAVFMNDTNHHKAIEANTPPDTNTLGLSSIFNHHKSLDTNKSGMSSNFMNNTKHHKPIGINIPEMCLKGVKIAKYYGISNQWLTEIKFLIQKIDPQNEALNICPKKFDPSQMFTDNIFFHLSGTLMRVKKSKDLSPKEKLSIYNNIIADSKRRNQKLNNKLNVLHEKMLSKKDFFKNVSPEKTDSFNCTY